MKHNLQSAHPMAVMFLYFFRIAAIVMYILGGYFNNYVLSVRTKSQTHTQERSYWAVEWNPIDINPLTLTDSNRGGAAVNGLLELQGKKIRPVSYPEIAQTATDMPFLVSRTSLEGYLSD